MRLQITTLALTIIVGFAPSPARAQGCMHGTGWSSGAPVQTTLTVAAGTIVDVQPAFRGGLRLSLKTEEGLLDVRIGSGASLADRHVQLVKGDRVEVSGVLTDGVDVLAARSLRIGDQSFVFEGTLAPPPNWVPYHGWDGHHGWHR